MQQKLQANGIMRVGYTLSKCILIIYLVYGYVVSLQNDVLGPNVFIRTLLCNPLPDCSSFLHAHVLAPIAVHRKMNVSFI